MIKSRCSALPVHYRRRNNAESAQKDLKQFQQPQQVFTFDCIDD
jgi:hypothetical protein